MTDVAYLTASELTVRYARRELSPVEVVHRTLERIEQLQPSLNAFAFVDADAAMTQARASEARWQHDAVLGPLDGVPVTVKDLLHVRGQPTRFGSRTRGTSAPWLDEAPAVTRLREAGAVVLGKTTTSEHGLKGRGDSPLTGVTRNPWNTALTPGGSSAGAVVATAAGLGAIALATDGGGSIRVPCALTGVIGLKPSIGRVPHDPPTFAGVPAQIGPVARSVSDIALALSIISRSDPRDPLHLPRLDEPRAHPRSLQGLRIGYSATLGYAQLDPDVAKAFEHAVELMRETGALLEPADPGFASPAPIMRTLFAARAAHTVASLTEDERALLDPYVAEAAREGRALDAVTYLQAEAERITLVQHMARYHERYALLITPTSAYPAAAHDPSPMFAAQPSFAAPFSLTRQPALSMPCGLTRDGLPIGLQIVGKHYADASVLAAARAFEHFMPFRPPPR